MEEIRNLIENYKPSQQALDAFRSLRIVLLVGVGTLAHHAVDLLMTRIARFSLPSRHREVPVKLIIRHSAK